MQGEPAKAEPLQGAGGAAGEKDTSDALDVETVLEAAPSTVAAEKLSELAYQLSTGDADGARLFTALLERKPVLLRLAELVIAEDRVSEALGWCARLLGEAPGHRGALLLKSLVELGEQDALAALTTSDQLVEAHPDDPDAYLHRGTVRLATLGLDKGERPGDAHSKGSRLALADYDTALRLAPGLAAGHLARGRALEQLGDLDRALAAYDEGLALDPSDLGGHVERGGLRLRRGEFEQAIRDCDAVIGQLDQDRATGRALLAEAHLIRARASTELGDLDGAADGYAEAVRLDPDLVEAYVEQGLLLNERGEYLAAKQTFELALRLDPDDPQALLGLGDALLALGEGWRASARYGSVLKQDRDSSPAHLGSAMAKLSNGHRERWRRRFDTAHDQYLEAVEHGEQAIRLDPGNPLAHAEFGRALRALVAYDEAASRFDEARAATEDPGILAVLLGEQGETLRLWGGLTIDANRYKEAVELLDWAVQLDAAPGDRAWLHRIRGEALASLRASESALHAFDLAIGIDPRSAWGYFGKGRLLLLISEHALAASAFQRMLELNIENSLNGLWASTGRLVADHSWLLECDDVPGGALPSLDNARTYLDRADVFDRLEAPVLAEHDRATALDMAAGSVDAACALARSYLQLEIAGSSAKRKRLRSALTLGLRALPAAGRPASRSDCHEVIGLAHAGLGDRARAVEHLRTAQALQPRNLRVRLHLEKASRA